VPAYRYSSRSSHTALYHVSVFHSTPGDYRLAALFFDTPISPIQKYARV
jgi:hypothetical protein